MNTRFLSRRLEKIKKKGKHLCFPFLPALSTESVIYALGTHKTCRGFFFNSSASSSIFPYFMQAAMQVLTQAGSLPSRVRGAQSIQSSVGNGRKER